MKKEIKKKSKRPDVDQQNSKIRSKNNKNWIY